MSSGPFETREQYELYKRARRHMAAQEAIQPLLQAKAAVVGMFMPRMLVYADGRVLVEYTAEQRTIFHQYDEMIMQAYQAALKV